MVFSGFYLVMKRLDDGEEVRLLHGESQRKLSSVPKRCFLRYGREVSRVRRVDISGTENRGISGTGG